jgi:hypothetical protein
VAGKNGEWQLDDPFGVDLKKPINPGAEPPRG